MIAALLLAWPANAGPLTDAAAGIERRLDALEKIVSPASVPVPIPAPVPVKPQVRMCAQGCDAATFSAAYAMVADGGTIAVQPGAYNDCLVIKKSLTVTGANARITGKACSNKGAFVVAAGNVTITGFDIGPVTGTEGNIACVRATEASTGLTLRGIKCHDTKMGVLAWVTGDVLIENSAFSNFASASATPHALYITEALRFTLRNSSVSISKTGHLVKTGAQRTVIEGSILAALDSKTSRTIDAYGGGELTIRNSVLQANNNESWHFMSYAIEAKRLNAAPHVARIENNTFINDYALEPPRKYKLFIPTAPLVSPIDAKAGGNKFVGLIGAWPDWVTEADTTRFETRAAAGLPAYDGTLASIKAAP